jgi:hypothetical protein
VLSLWGKIMAFRFKPNQGFKLYWDLLIILLSIMNSFLLPLQFSLPNTFDNLKNLDIFDSFVDVLFVMDLFFNARTIYVDSKSDEYVYDGRRIFCNYLKNGFLIDAVASIPIDKLILLVSSGGIDVTSGKFFSMLKLVRLLRLGRMIHYFSLNQGMKYGMKSLQMFIIIMVYINLAACLWVKIFKLPSELTLEDVSSFDPQFDEDNQKLMGFIPIPERLKFSHVDFEKSEDRVRYNLMLFMTLFNIMGNDISPTRPDIFWVSAILMLTGFLIVGYIIGEFANLLNEIYDSDANDESEQHIEMVS